MSEFESNTLRGGTYEYQGLNCVVIMNGNDWALISPLTQEKQFVVPISELGRMITIAPREQSAEDNLD